jgi:hypothetical protein
MKRPSVFVLALVVMVCPAWAAEETGFVAMFNGKDLTGWEGKPGAWRVEDGSIVGESTVEKPCEKTHYLYWKGGAPANFIMRAKIKLTGVNSGIQFRSEKRPDFDTFGYQADFDDANKYTGCLYQHKRGPVSTRGQRIAIAEDGRRKVETFATSEELEKKIKNNGWNDYEIVAKGSKVALRLNGELMSEVDDRDAKLACSKGIIALQMHKGPPMKVEFKDLRIKILK